MKAVVSEGDVLDGDPRLEGTRIGVVHIYRRYEDGETPEEVAASYDGVTVADVHAALAYAFENADEIRAIEANAREAVDRIRENRPVDPEEFKERA